MGIRRKLLRISRWLGTFPSIGYALIYLLMIPGFGLIYWMLPGQFHHATLQHEATLSNQFVEIKAMLKTVVDSSFKSQTSPHVYLDGPELTTWALRPATLTNLFVTDKVRFRLEIDYFDAHSRYSRLATWVSFPVEESSFGSNYHQTEEYQFLDFELEPETLDVFPDKARQKTLTNLLFPPDGGLRVPRPLMETIRSYSSGSRGIGSEVQGNYWRMFYLSAVTITTVGYGDIVPLTTSARMLVSVEAILGIVLIGLFLNSLAYERAEAGEIYKEEQDRESSQRANERVQETLDVPEGGSVVKDGGKSFLT